MGPRVSRVGAPRGWDVDVGSYLYEIVSAEPLPEIDFSVSIKSRFVNASWLPLLTRLTRYRRAILAVYSIGNALAIGVMAGEARVGRWLSPFSCLLMLPAPLAGLLVLRFNMVRALVRTFDFWFSLTTMTATLVLLAAQLADVRICSVFATWSCMFPNLFLDANLRGVKRMAISNIMAIVACIVLLYVLNAGGGVDAATNFALYRYGPRAIRSSDFIVSGFATMVAQLARNVVRLRGAFSLAAGRREVDCVSYRAVLRVRPKPPLQSGSQSFRRRGPRVSKADYSPIQRLKLKTAAKTIDVRQTLWPAAVCAIANSPAWCRLAYRVVGWGTFLLSAIATAIVSDRTSSFMLQSRLSYATVASTSVFVALSAVTFQRQLLWRLVSSFDFLYLSAQVTVIHLTACDVDKWVITTCCVVSASWLWVHWALCNDAVSPLVKDTISIHRRFPAAVLTLSVLNGVVLLYEVMRRETSYDRVVLVFGSTVDVGIGLMPLLSTGLATLLMLSTRLLYRAWTFSGDKLLVLDGEVVYQNYLAVSKLRMASVSCPVPSNRVTPYPAG